MQLHRKCKETTVAKFIIYCSCVILYNLLDKNFYYITGRIFP